MATIVPCGDLGATLNRQTSSICIRNLVAIRLLTGCACLAHKQKK
jgi:hypothetical protein